MKAAVISLGSKSSLWTIEAMQKYFESVDNLNLKKIGVRTSADGLQVLYDEKPMLEYDCVYVKGSFKYPLLLRSIAHGLESKAYTPIKAEVFTLGHDKWLSHLALQKANIPMPTTYLTSTVDAAKVLLKDLMYPVILKFPSGTQGKGVMFVESYAAASSTLDALSALNQPVIIQDYVETGGVDLRVIVTGDKVAASMKRIAVIGEKRANIHAGGSGEAFEPDHRTKKVAIQTAEAIGADVCAVDLLESAKGPVVIEVNLSPGLQGITKATGINVADKIASYLHDQTVKFVSQKKASVSTKDILKDVGVAAAEDGRINEIISTLDMRGNRLLLPENVSKMTKFNEKGEYIIKFENNELVIKRMKMRK